MSQLISDIADTSSDLFKGRAFISAFADSEKMEDTFDIADVRKRLKVALKSKGLSMRRVSEDAKLNPGYVHSILSSDREPTIGNLAKICKVADLSLSYVMYGFEMSPETERLISLLEKNPEKRASMLALLE